MESKRVFSWLNWFYQHTTGSFDLFLLGKEFGDQFKPPVRNGGVCKGLFSSKKNALKENGFFWDTFFKHTQI